MVHINADRAKGACMAVLTGASRIWLKKNHQSSRVSHRMNHQSSQSSESSNESSSNESIEWIIEWIEWIIINQSIISSCIIINRSIRSSPPSVEDTTRSTHESVRSHLTGLSVRPSSGTAASLTQIIRAFTSYYFWHSTQKSGKYDAVSPSFSPTKHLNLSFVSVKMYQKEIPHPEL